jgi:hypothetical protein
MEIVYANMYNKVVYIVVTNGHIQHPWLQYHGTRLFESLKDFEKFLKKEAPKEPLPTGPKLPEVVIPTVFTPMGAPADGSD